jgi:hypothetical protein
VNGGEVRIGSVPLAIAAVAGATGAGNSASCGVTATAIEIGGTAVSRGARSAQQSSAAPGAIVGALAQQACVAGASGPNTHLNAAGSTAADAMTKASRNVDNRRM